MKRTREVFFQVYLRYFKYDQNRENAVSSSKQLDSLHALHLTRFRNLGDFTQQNIRLETFPIYPHYERGRQLRK